jgi:hypothetical protein
MKDLTVSFSPVWIILTRFALAVLILSPFLWRAHLDDLRSGVLLGLVLFFCYLFQVEGLALTSSNRNAFITGLNVLVVPLLGVLGGRLPERRIVFALVLAVAGLAALCWTAAPGVAAIRWRCWAPSASAPTSSSWKSAPAAHGAC